jgi:hypothetical protein
MYKKKVKWIDVCQLVLSSLSLKIPELSWYLSLFQLPTLTTVNSVPYKQQNTYFSHFGMLRSTRFRCQLWLVKSTLPSSSWLSFCCSSHGGSGEVVL